MKKLYHFAPMVILSIFLVIFIVLIEAALYAKHVLFKPDIYANAMNEKEVTQAMYDEINTNFGYYAAPTGIPQEVFTSSYTKDELYTASFKLLTDSLAYITDKNAPKPVISYDFSKVEKNITDYIEKDAEQRSIEKTKEYYTMIANTVKMSKDQITTRLDVMMLYKLSGTKGAELVHDRSDLFGIVIWALIGTALLILIIMVVIDRHHPRDYPYWLGLVLMASSGTLLVPAVYLKSTNYFEAFFIKSEYIHRTVTGLFEIILNDIIRFELIMLIIGALLVLSTQVIHIVYVGHLKKKWQKKQLFEHKAVSDEHEEHTPLLTEPVALSPVPQTDPTDEIPEDAAERAASTAKTASTDDISNIIDEVLSKARSKDPD